MEVLLLWLLIAATAIAFWQITWIGSLLLVPYLLWVSFAAALNAALWLADPNLLG